MNAVYIGPHEEGVSENCASSHHFVSKYQYEFFFIHSNASLIKPEEEKFN